MGFENIHHHFRFSFSKELSQIYISVMIRSLALSLIAIFIPIYLYSNLGYSLEKLVCFLIIVFLSFGLFTSFSAHLSVKIGFKHNIFLSSICYIIAFLMLNLLNQNFIFFLLTPILLGLANSLYWLSFHIDAAKSTTKKYRGQQMAIWEILSGSVGIVGPFLAGLILKFSSFNTLFMIGSIILILSTIPLFFSKDQHIKSNFSYKYIFQREHLNNGIKFISAGSKYIAHGLLWPLFIFILLAEYFKFGSVISLLSIFSLISYGIIGKLSDIKKPISLIKWGALINFFASAFMGLAKTIIHIVSISIAAIFSITLIDLPMTKRVYEIGKKTNIVEYIAFREIMLNIGRVLLLLIFLLLLNLQILEKYAFIIIFIISGLAGIGFFIKQKNK